MLQRLPNTGKRVQIELCPAALYRRGRSHPLNAFGRILLIYVLVLHKAKITTSIILPANTTPKYCFN